MSTVSGMYLHHAAAMVKCQATPCHKLSCMCVTRMCLHCSHAEHCELCIVAMLNNGELTGPQELRWREHSVLCIQKLLLHWLLPWHWCQSGECCLCLSTTAWPSFLIPIETVARFCRLGSAVLQRLGLHTCKQIFAAYHASPAAFLVDFVAQQHKRKVLSISWICLHDAKYCFALHVYTHAL